MDRGARRIGAELPHDINDVGIVRCDVKRMRDVRAPTGELNGWGPVDSFFN